MWGTIISEVVFNSNIGFPIIIGGQTTKAMFPITTLGFNHYRLVNN